MIFPLKNANTLFFQIRIFDVEAQPIEPPPLADGEEDELIPQQPYEEPNQCE
jgi:hypothetical protein